MTTASKSSRSKLNQSSRGYALSPEISPGLIPQSSITLLSGVTTIKHDLPTCLTPPRQKSITSSLLADQSWGFAEPCSLVVACRYVAPFPLPLPITSDPLKIRLPSFCIKSVLSFADPLSVEWMMLMLVDGMWGERLVCAIHPVDCAIRTTMLGSIASGLLTSSTTSP